MKYADLHIHSKYSSVGLYNKSASLYERIIIDCASEVEKIFSIAKKKGLSAIAIADHDNQLSLPEAERYAKKYNIVNIPAIEIGSMDGHIVGLGVEGSFTPNLSAAQTIREINDKGGLAVAAHPFLSHQHDLMHIRKKKGLDINDVNENNFDAVEFYNSIFGEAIKEERLKKKISYIAGSDAHTYYQIGCYLTGFPDSCKTKKDYLEAISSGKTIVIGKKPSYLLMSLAGIKTQLWDRHFLDYDLERST